MIYTCGGCKKPYETHSEDGPTRATCPRCNPGRTLNKPVSFGPSIGPCKGNGSEPVTLSR
jgi:DNA-directed RNA polymerase subunit RPC12/RpoP